MLDALDKCDDFDDIRLLLHLLDNTQNLASFDLRVLMTSRLEISIRLEFNNIKYIAYFALTLHDVSRVIVD